MSDPTQRFSDRVGDYVKARPGYPAGQIFGLLKDEAGWTPGSAVADVGSGTGISARLFLDQGNLVFAVEPNPDMRRAAEAAIGNHARFHSIDGTSESTGLADGSVDLIVAAQAFHWFRPEPTKQEFLRILKPGGAVVLMWNDRRLGGTPFLEAYENLLLEFGTDYLKVRHGAVDGARLREFLGPFSEARFDNEQVFDFEGLAGRLRSSSYVPAPGAPRFGEMMAALREIFDRHQRGGRVVMTYDVRIYLAVWAHTVKGT